MTWSKVDRELGEAHTARVKPQLASILLRETRRSAVFRGTAIRSRRTVERVCNISGSPDSFPCSERTGTLVTSRKRKVTHIILELAFLREICRVSRSELSLTVVTSAVGPVVEYLDTGRILDESVCHLLALLPRLLLRFITKSRRVSGRL